MLKFMVWISLHFFFTNIAWFISRATPRNGVVFEPCMIWIVNYAKKVLLNLILPRNIAEIDFEKKFFNWMGEKNIVDFKREH